MLIMFLPMPSGPSGPWVAGTKNLKERKIYAFSLVFLGFISAGLIFWISFFVDKIDSISAKTPTTLMGSLLTDAGFNIPLCFIASIVVLLASFVMSFWVGGSEKPAARIAAIVFSLLQVLLILSAYIPV